MAGGRSLSTENDFLRGLALAPGLQTHGQRVAHRNSTHSFALDKTFRFIDGMTRRGQHFSKERGAEMLLSLCSVLLHENRALNLVIPSINRKVLSRANEWVELR